MTFLHTCACVSARPLISEVYFGRALVPTVPSTLSLCLHSTNCELSSNTLSAFNYCLRVLGSGMHIPSGTAVGALALHACMCSWSDLTCKMSIERSVEFHWTSPSSPSLAHHMSHTADLPPASSEPSWKCKWLTKVPLLEHLECVWTPIMSV